MDTDQVFLVIILTVLIVVGVNGILYLALRRGNETNLINLTRKTFQNARNPWQEEDQSLQELSRLVAELKSQNQTKPTDTPAVNGATHQEPGNTNAQ